MDDFGRLPSDVQKYIVMLTANLPKVDCVIVGVTPHLKITSPFVECLLLLPTHFDCYRQNVIDFINGKTNTCEWVGVSINNNIIVITLTDIYLDGILLSEYKVHISALNSLKIALQQYIDYIDQKNEI